MLRSARLLVFGLVLTSELWASLAGATDWARICPLIDPKCPSAFSGAMPAVSGQYAYFTSAGAVDSGAPDRRMMRYDLEARSLVQVSTVEDGSVQGGFYAVTPQGKVVGASVFGLTVSQDGNSPWVWRPDLFMNSTAAAVNTVRTIGPLLIARDGSWMAFGALDPFYRGSYLFSSVDQAEIWTTRIQASPNASSIELGSRRGTQSLALGEGIRQIIAIGSAGVLVTEDFGANWVVRVPVANLGPGIYLDALFSDQHLPGNYYLGTSADLRHSSDYGQTWRELARFDAGVHSVVVLRRGETKWIVVASGERLLASRDEGVNWQEFSAGLYAWEYWLETDGKHLFATDTNGLFICEDLDCLGRPISLNRNLIYQYQGIDVVEFHHPGLNHYTLAADPLEILGIENGLAGRGWVRTGQKMRAWDITSNPKARPVCRFYGSVTPGPNSHFFTADPIECAWLRIVEQATPLGQPRLQIEGIEYAFELLDPQTKACPKNRDPVFRAYNNGDRRGIDSNHRYVTDRALLQSLVAQGWIDEGAAFCVRSRLVSEF